MKTTIAYWASLVISNLWVTHGDSVMATIWLSIAAAAFVADVFWGAK